MAEKSTILWTEATWNPVTGCTKASSGCKHCYAERMTYRLQGMGQAKYRNGFKVTVHPEALEIPLGWKKPRRIFVNSMSDIFHEQVRTRFIKKVFEIMVQAEHHQFQLLTKRSKRMAALAPSLPWPKNIWMGVTVESAVYLSRISDLITTPAVIKFVSFEPLLGPIDRFCTKGIDWVIVGGESGPGARPMREEWVTDLRDKCLASDVPFLFKQWGGRNKRLAGRTLDGRIWSQYPWQTSDESL